MYEVRCPNCGWSAALSDEHISAAVAEADRLRATHHIEHCPRCQWVIRLPIDGLRAVVPAPAPATPEPMALSKTVAKRPAAKTAPAKKPVAKKAAAKKPAVKKPTAKKPAAKKPTAKKPAAKKPAAKSKK